MQKIKCVVVGDAAIGKTCAIVSYTKNNFQKTYFSTIFDNLALISLMTNGESCFLDFYDTAGKEKYDYLRTLSYPQTHIFLVCFSVINYESFENVRDKWVPEILNFCKQASFLLVGTQVDLREDSKILNKLEENKLKPISFEQGEKLAKEIKAVKYVECSALTQVNIHFTYYK